MWGPYGGLSYCGTQTRIAIALERIADNQELLLSCDEEILKVLREFASEFGLFSRNGFGL